MATHFSSGSADMDALFEELRAGDNVVFYTSDWQCYLPFVASLLPRAITDSARVIYVRSEGLLDGLVAKADGIETLDLSPLAGLNDAVTRLQEEMARIGPGVYYVFEPLHSLAPWLFPAEELANFFTSICPLLFRLETVCYWDLVRGHHSAAEIATIKDCTQIMVEVERQGQHLVLTPIKVWGRYSEGMFRPHRVQEVDGQLHLESESLPQEDSLAYAAALESKNREMARIRDALDRSNQELERRNRELAELNERLIEQSRRYEALHNSMDYLLELFQVGQAISSSLVEDQVRKAIVSAAMRLFEAPACRLYLSSSSHQGNREVIKEGLNDEWERRLASPDVEELRSAASRSLQPKGITLRVQGGLVEGSIGLAPIAARGECLGTLEVCAYDDRLYSQEALSFLAHLASEAGIALDNARLYRKVESQGAQLQYFVEEIIKNEEQESRRFALDLHDGLVQTIVVAYQHLQSAQAWREHDPLEEEMELEKGVNVLRSAIYEARRIITRLRPAGLDDFGLVHALRLHVAQLAQDADWQVQLTIDENLPILPEALEAALFRIAQEASTNALKHAKTSRLEIILGCNDTEVCLVVRDWGQGFDPSHALADQDRGRRVGLIGMSERARLWGGRCEIESEIGSGTVITVVVPIPKERLPESAGL